MNKKIKALLIVLSIALVGFALIVFASYWIASRQIKTSKFKIQQSEAKSNLVMAFTNQKAFYAEFGFYTSAIEGSMPESVICLNYKVGFSNVLQLTDVQRKNIETSGIQINPEDNTSDALGVKCKNIDVDKIDFIEATKNFNCTVSAETFKVCAVGLDPETKQYDVWSINQDKILINETAPK